jgi:hypothetical protein
MDGRLHELRGAPSAICVIAVRYRPLQAEACSFARPILRPASTHPAKPVI